MQRTLPAERLRIAFELAQLAEDMQRAREHRRHPQLSAAEIEARIDAWYRDRPGAEHGDAEGRHVAPEARGWRRG